MSLPNAGECYSHAEVAELLMNDDDSGKEYINFVHHTVFLRFFLQQKDRLT